jgi:AcrR family transcriptional regulator
MPRPKQRTPELAEAVLRAGLRLVTEEGFGALTARRLAADAGTSPAAVYELFGDKAGVVRALFFSGFERLGEQLGEPAKVSGSIDELLVLAQRYRGFIVEHPSLAAIMFSQPFTTFDPGPEEQAAGAAVRDRVLHAVRTAIDAGDLVGDPIDIGHAYVSLIQGLAAAECARRLGRSNATVQRRWDVSVNALLRGFGPPATHRA